MTGPLKAQLDQEVDAARRSEIIEQELVHPNLNCLTHAFSKILTGSTAGLSQTAPLRGMMEQSPTSRRGTALNWRTTSLISAFCTRNSRIALATHGWFSRSAQREASLADGVKGMRLLSLLGFFRGHQDYWSDEAYSGIAKGLLFARRRIRVSPLLLRGLGVTSVDEIHSATGPLSFLPDEGDRMVAAEALIANVPVLLTTDRRTLWKHRIELDAFGLAVMRPTELLKLYEPYWQALDEEFMRRSDTQR